MVHTLMRSVPYLGLGFCLAPATISLITLFHHKKKLLSTIVLLVSLCLAAVLIKVDFAQFHLKKVIGIALMLFFIALFTEQDILLPKNKSSLKESEKDRENK